MSVIATNQTKTFPIAPEGTHSATCIAIIDIGTHAIKTGLYAGKLSRKVRIMWELPTELDEEGKPFVIHQDYTLSMAEKGNLRAALKAWRGKDFTAEEAARFDVGALIGKPCLLGVIHNKQGEKTYANPSSIAAFPYKMMKPHAPSCETIVYSIDQAIPPNMPEWIAKKIQESAEWRAKDGGVEQPVNRQAAPSVHDEDEPPF